MSLCPEECKALEDSLGGGLVAYVNRLRAGHGVTFPKPGVRGVCRCGEPGCAIAPLLVHIDDLRLAYALKVEDLARETMIADDLRAALGEGGE